MSRPRAVDRLDPGSGPVRITRFAWQRTWLAFAGSVIATVRTGCGHCADATVFSLAATTAAAGGMLLAWHVHRISRTVHSRRRQKLRPQAVSLASGALLTCALALPFFHAITLTGRAARPHTSRQMSYRSRPEAAAPPGPPVLTDLPLAAARRHRRPPDRTWRHSGRARRPHAPRDSRSLRGQRQRGDRGAGPAASTAAGREGGGCRLRGSPSPSRAGGPPAGCSPPSEDPHSTMLGTSATEILDYH